MQHGDLQWEICPLVTGELLMTTDMLRLVSQYQNNDLETCLKYFTVNCATIVNVVMHTAYIFTCTHCKLASLKTLLVKNSF